MAILRPRLVGLQASLAGRSRDGPATWLLSTVAGALAFLYAGAMDREANRHLEVDVDSITGGEDSTETITRGPSREDGEEPDERRVGALANDGDAPIDSR
jgi:hypothetical protein